MGESLEPAAAGRNRRRHVPRGLVYLVSAPRGHRLHCRHGRARGAQLDTYSKQISLRSLRLRSASSGLPEGPLSKSRARPVTVSSRAAGGAGGGDWGKASGFGSVRHLSICYERRLAGQPGQVVASFVGPAGGRWARRFALRSASAASPQGRPCHTQRRIRPDRSVNCGDLLVLLRLFIMAAIDLATQGPHGAPWQ